MNAPPPISVVIPALNEAGDIRETILRARAVPEIGEMILVDGGSTDSTGDLAAALGCRVLRSPAGRGRQLRLGAQQARGEVVLMLHADTWLPPEAGRAALESLRDGRCVAGAFSKSFRDGGALPGSRLRCWLLWRFARRAFGDQALFVKRAALEAVGGVPDVPLMEEFELCRKLEAHGRLALADATVLTSARRFRQHGTARTYWRMLRCLLAYWRGAAPEQIASLYFPTPGP